jgi:Asp-tRNA(Asn)/Glu-tRNA(Gln) amidotransferase A subunit family amidase
MKPYRNRHAVSFSQALPAFLSGKDTPRAFLERCIARIEAKEKSVKAFVTLNLKGARAAADAATKRYKAGQPLSPVDGCPVAIKDIIATEDMPTQMNNAVFAGWQSGQDAACVQALRRGGAVIIGKTVTTEFAIGGPGPTTNPHDASRTPGGSSSGTAASVGAGMVPVGLGTQTQGSTIRPASYCGAYALKPTLGALPLGGVHPLSVTHDHLGVIAGSLADTWRIASHISLTMGSPGAPHLSGASANLPEPRKPRRLIRLYTRGWNEVDGPTRVAVETLMKGIAQRGVELITRETNPAVASFEDRLDGGVAGSLDMIAYEMKWPFGDYVAKYGDRIGERIRGLVQRASDMKPAEYESLLQAQRSIRMEARKLAEGTDGFLLLSASGIAPKGHAFTGSRTFLAYWSWLGYPAFSLPYLQVHDLPLGLQLAGLGQQDGALCSIAHWLDREFAN